MVAVVGRSGSGKTTLSKLILGLYPATDGKVLIDGCDITSVSLRSLRSQIGVVDQDTFLFGGTIRENIAIAHPNASSEEIIQAAKYAGADDFIQKLPMGYESQIGEGGGMLSGGQRQRLAIARARLGNDVLTGGSGNDVLIAGGGNDTFVFKNVDTFLRNDYDVIQDFQVGDKIVLNGWGFGNSISLLGSVKITDTTNGAVIQLNSFLNQETILVSGVSASVINNSQSIQFS